MSLVTSCIAVNTFSCYFCLRSLLLSLSTPFPLLPLSQISLFREYRQLRCGIQAVCNLLVSLSHVSCISSNLLSYIFQYSFFTLLVSYYLLLAACIVAVLQSYRTQAYALTMKSRPSFSISGTLSGHHYCLYFYPDICPRLYSESHITSTHQLSVNLQPDLSVFQITSLIHCAEFHMRKIIAFHESPSFCLANFFYFYTYVSHWKDSDSQHTARTFS